jgi:hypothetical protein
MHLKDKKIARFFNETIPMELCCGVKVCALADFQGINVWPLTNTSCFEYTGNRDEKMISPQKTGMRGEGDINS